MENKASVPVVAIVGRPNVGKSSLFNAILRRRAAIVHSESGVTRDRVSALCEFLDRKFQLIDTGGLSLYDRQSAKDVWSREIRRQVELAVESADKILFVVEAGEPLPLDEDIARKLRVSGKDIIVVLNKADNDNSALTSANFARLGFERIFPVSCVHRIGLDYLLEELTKDFPKVSATEAQPFKIALAGRPNVGKSSLVNRMLREERMLVSEIPGTTRDAVESEAVIRAGGREMKISFVDTAGLRQRRKADSPVEIFSIDRTEKAIMKADMALLLLEPFFDGASAQDRRIGGMIKESGKACIIAVNKSDLCEKSKKRELETRIRATMPFLNYAPLVFVSALRGEGMPELCSTMISVANSVMDKPPTAVINKIMEEAQGINPPPNNFKIYYSTFVGGSPPAFLVFCNNPKLCPQHYLSFIENSMRKKFHFTGLPIAVRLRGRKEK